MLMRTFLAFLRYPLRVFYLPCLVIKVHDFRPCALVLLPGERLLSFPCPVAPLFVTLARLPPCSIPPLPATLATLSVSLAPLSCAFAPSSLAPFAIYVKCSARLSCIAPLILPLFPPSSLTFGRPLHVLGWLKSSWSAVTTDGIC